MTVVHSEDEFFAIAETLRYKDLDEAEARDFRCKNVLGCLKASNQEYAKYYTVQEYDKVLVAIILQRDGNLSYFVTKDFTSAYTLKVIAEVKKLADDTLLSAGAIFVKTAKFYKEAIRFVKIVGFLPYKIEYSSITWVYDGRR